MGPSSNRRNGRFIVGLDRAAVGGLVSGLALYVVPFWREGRLRWAFWLTLVSTLLHIWSSHKRSKMASSRLSAASTAGQTGAVS